MLGFTEFFFSFELYHSLGKNLKVSFVLRILFKYLRDLNYVCEWHSATFYLKLSIYTSSNFMIKVSLIPVSDQ